MPSIAIDLLDPPLHKIHPPGRLTENSDLVLSIRAMGMLTPILVMPEGNRYRIIDGLRRHEAAMLLGLEAVPVHIDDAFPGPHALVAGVATNLIREALPPTQQWRALAALQEAEKVPLDRAAAYLGMDPRHARRLARLGNLCPELLDALARIEANPEGHGVPALGDRQLGLIASAPIGVQQAAFEACRDDDGDPIWDRIALRCTVQRISAQHAIFDIRTAGVLFDDDLFAEPGGADQFTTADIDGFIAAQRLALAEQVDGLRPKRRWHVTEQEGHAAARQAGMQPVCTYAARPRLSGDEHCFGFVRTTGWDIGRVAWTTATPKASAKATREPKPAEDDEAEADASAEAEEDPVEEHPAEPTQPAADIRPLTKAGQTLLAQAKTAALGDALRAFVKDADDWRDVVAFLILAFHARNVTVKSRPHLADDRLATFRACIDPSGQFIRPDDTTLAGLAAATLATVLSIDDPANSQNRYFDLGSGDVAEWIGHAINAGEHLPRLDSKEFLASVNAEHLRAAVISITERPAKTAAAMRQQLAGNAEAWRPPGSEFGAAGPKPLPADRRRKPAGDVEDAA